MSKVKNPQVSPTIEQTIDRNTPNGKQITIYTIIPGMTLLDHFAGQAMIAFGIDGREWSPDMLAHNAYIVADYMLKERQERNK